MSDPKDQLRARGLTPKKSFGQNFLRDVTVTEDIARACVPDTSRPTVVVEWGAGTGVLTAALLRRGARVTAVERDRDLVPLLHETFATQLQDGTLRVLEADAKVADPLRALEEHAAAAPTAERVVCGNLPYQLTGMLIERSVHIADRLTRAVFMVQREVAERLDAAPGSKTYGALTVFVRAQFRVRWVRAVGSGAFYPPPNVESAVVELVPAPRARETEAFRAVVRAAFAARRKTLRNAWRSLFTDEGALGAAAARAAVDLTLRGETLDVEDFARMARELEADAVMHT
jgi:16S rRNA (adenine1518-N6/adenine1519-N6)-dimethyltransferase